MGNKLTSIYWKAASLGLVNKTHLLATNKQEP